MSGINDVTLYNAAFAGTGPFTSEEASISDSKQGTTIFVAATGVDVTISIQAQDPVLAWHTITTNVTTSGNTDAIPLLCNMGKLRVLVAPASATGSAIIWTRSFGG